MKSIQLLDTTLRDGGFRTQFHFSDEDLKQVLIALDQSGIEYIEVGYRNGISCPNEKIGRAGYCDKHYLQMCKSLIKKATIAVMAIPGNIQESDVSELKEHNVGLIRFCATKDNLNQILPIMKLAKQINIKIAINFVNMTHYTEQELDELLASIAPHEPDIVYFADSNGSILPQRITAIYERYCNKHPFIFGFHAHDNIGLAHANAIAAMDSGAGLIDASLAGLGKGIGNLKTEFFIAYLHAIKVKKYNLATVLEAANYVRQTLQAGKTTIALNEFLKGISDNSESYPKS